MTMEPQSLMNLAIWAVLVVLGWLAREVWQAVKSLQHDIHTIEVALPSTYVKKDELTSSIKEIKDLCDKIFTKLDNLNDRKVDKQS